MYGSPLVFAIWFYISLLLISIILSDIGMSEAHFSEPEFWLRYPVAGSHTQSSASEENKQQYWSKKNLPQAKKPKMDQHFSLQQCFLGSLPLKVWAVFCSCQEECGQRQTSTGKGVEVFLHCQSVPLLSPRPAPFTFLENHHRTVWVGRNVQRQSCPSPLPWTGAPFTDDSVPLHPNLIWTLKVPTALTSF